MQKAKKYDWKDSNLALFGSDTEKKVKKESAESEPAWKGAGQSVGLQIWRIVKFKVTHWDKDDYGKFYDGDSYIILNTYKNPGEEDLEYDVHFWIGQDSTQDEYGTAAYKTVELDTLLDDKPVQHREVQNHESALFKSYFPRMEIMSGGADTGFKRVTPTQYQSRLLHFSGTRKHIEVKEVPFSKKSLKSDDVFILDAGLKLYLWIGSSCNKDEKFKATQHIATLKSERGKAESESLDEGDFPSTHPFNSLLPDVDIEQESEGDDSSPRAMYRLSDAGGKMEFTLVTENELSKADLDSNDVFIVDTTKHLYVWVGKGASIDERRNCMTYAHNYLMKTSHPLLPVTVVSEGKEKDDFNAVF
ncbi:gelsolin-like protein 2 [Diadema setosum]|uniref:gelsolin-like protein 2 n=1 Tax=Diadema setosum TaxID=31175 RepID=UPI003B3B2F78